MGLIQDVGGKLVQSFLTLDDLVLGQGLVSEGLSQLGLSGRSVAGSVVGSANVAARTVQAGIQVGAKTAKATAALFEGFVPGAGWARAMAERMDEEATAAAEEASQLTSHAVELTGGEPPRNPLSKQTWHGKAAPRGYTWGELAADTAVSTLGRFAMLPVTLGFDAMTSLASTAAGRQTIDSALAGAGMLLDLLPGTSSTDLDAAELRESLMAVTASTGDSAARSVVALAEASARFALGDTRKLHQAIEEAIEQAHLLASHAEMKDLMPAVPISSTVKERARSMVDHAPTKFLKALRRGPKGEAPTPGPILQAMLEDADNLRVFATEYPLVLGLMGTNTAMMMTAGMVDVNEVESWVRNDDGGDEKSRPWSATQIEAYVGKAPDGTFFEATVRAAQDAAFAYSSEVLGRKKALARAERIHDKDVRKRLEDDVSLDLKILRAKAGEERDDKIRAHIAGVSSDRRLMQQRDHCQEQLDSLEAFTASLYGYRTKTVSDRTKILELFLSLSGQELALRGTPQQAAAEEAAAEARTEAKASFYGSIGELP